MTHQADPELVPDERDHTPQHQVQNCHMINLKLCVCGCFKIYIAACLFGRPEDVAPEIFSSHCRHEFLEHTHQPLPTTMGVSLTFPNWTNSSPSVLHILGANPALQTAVVANLVAAIDSINTWVHEIGGGTLSK